MKRPLAIVGFTLMTTLLIVNFIELKNMIYISVIIGILYFFSFFIKNYRKKNFFNLIFVSVLSGLILYSAYNIAYVSPIKELNNQNATIDARLIESPYEHNANFYYTVSTDSVKTENGDKVPQNIKLTLHSFSPIDISYSDNMKVNVQFNEVNTEYIDYNYSHNVFIEAEIIDSNIVTSNGTNNDILAFILSAKDTIIDRVYDILPYTQATLANAILLGDKRSLQQDIKTNFYDTSVGHLIVVSGLHLSIIANFIFMLALFFKKNNRLASICAIISIIVFMTITGFSVSVVRAGLMLIIMFSGYLFRYRNDSINSIGLAGIVLCLLNPYSMLDVSLLLSFTATLAIILLYSPTKTYILHKLLKRECIPKVFDVFLSIGVLTCCVVFSTIPITFIYFRTMSPYFLISNLLLVYPATLLLISTLFMIVFSVVPIFSILSLGFAFITTIVCNYMITVVKTIESLPYSNINIDVEFFKIWIIITIALISTVMIITKKKSSLKLTVPLSICVLVVLFISSTVVNMNKINIEFVSSGDGISAILYKNNTCAVLSSGGSYGNDNTIEEIDRFSDIDLQVIGDRKVNKAYSPEILYNKEISSVVILDTYKNDEIIQLAEDKQENVMLFDDVQNITLWDNVNIKLFSYDNMMWQYIECEEKTILIAPENADFSTLYSQYLNVDYLILNETPENINLIKSEVVILSSSNSGVLKMEEEISEYLKDKEVYTTQYENQYILIDEG